MGGGCSAKRWLWRGTHGDRDDSSKERGQDGRRLEGFDQDYYESEIAWTTSPQFQ